jgi:hypothetical protein
MTDKDDGAKDEGIAACWDHFRKINDQRVA